MEKRKTGLLKKIAITTALLVTAVSVLLVYMNVQKYSATTMRLLRVQGDVKLLDKGKEKTITENFRFSSGNTIFTAIESLASIALDDAKIITLNDSSRALFEQSGKKLNIKLTEGSLFFEVTQKLAADETFDIRTSSMTVGIRGTSGYVAVDENGHETLYITDGKVVVTGVNPVTNEKKTVEVKAGEKVQVYLYNDRTEDSIMFHVEPVSEKDLGKNITDRLLENEELLAKVISDTGWSKELILGVEFIDETDVPTSPEPNPDGDGDGNGGGINNDDNDDDSDGDDGEGVVVGEADDADADLDTNTDGSGDDSSENSGDDNDVEVAKLPSSISDVLLPNNLAATPAQILGNQPANVVPAIPAAAESDSGETQTVDNTYEAPAANNDAPAAVNNPQQTDNRDTGRQAASDANVGKDDLNAIDNKTDEGQNQNVAENPVKDETADKAQEPQAEEPTDKGQEPQAEEPTDKGQEPQAEEPTDKGQEPQAEEPIDENQEPKDSEPVDENQEPQDGEPIDENQEPQDGEPIDENQEPIDKENENWDQEPIDENNDGNLDGYDNPDDGNLDGYDNPDDGNLDGYDNPDDGNLDGYDNPDDGNLDGYDNPDDGNLDGYDNPDDGNLDGYDNPDDGNLDGYDNPDDGNLDGYDNPDDGNLDGYDTPDNGNLDGSDDPENEKYPNGENGSGRDGDGNDTGSGEDDSGSSGSTSSDGNGDDGVVPTGG